MSLPKFNPRTLVLFLIILVIGIVRVIFIYDDKFSSVNNFSPVGAMALFGGAYFNKTWKAFCFPILTLFISDVFLSLTVYSEISNGILYGGWYWVYSAFVLMTIAGRLLIKKVTPLNILVATVVSVCIHWVVSDIGVWYGSTLYPQTLSGFAACLIAAIPFEWRFLTGTLVYGTILFGLFEWMQQKYSALKTA